MNAKQVMTFRAKMIHATSTPAEQAAATCGASGVGPGLAGPGVEYGGRGHSWAVGWAWGGVG